MAQVRRWKETVILACVTFLMSAAQAWPRGTRETANGGNLEYSRLIVGLNGMTPVGVELMPQKPYARLVRTSRVPVPPPQVPGAYVALASAPVAGDAASVVPECGTTGGGGGTTGTSYSCWSVSCFYGSRCLTCGHGTCISRCC